MAPTKMMPALNQARLRAASKNMNEVRYEVYAERPGEFLQLYFPASKAWAMAYKIRNLGWAVKRCRPVTTLPEAS